MKYTITISTTIVTFVGALKPLVFPLEDRVTAAQITAMSWPARQHFYAEWAARFTQEQVEAFRKSAADKIEEIMECSTTAGTEHRIQQIIDVI